MDDFFSSVPVSVLVTLGAALALLVWWAIHENRRYRSPEAVAARAKWRADFLAEVAHEQHLAAEADEQHLAAVARGDAHTAGEWAAGTLVFVVAAPVVGGLAFVIGLFVTQFIAWFFAFWEPLVVVLSWIAWIFVGMMALGFTIRAASSVMDSMTKHRLQRDRQ